MKGQLYFSALACAALMFAGCDDDDDNGGAGGAGGGTDMMAMGGAGGGMGGAGGGMGGAGGGMGGAGGGMGGAGGGMGGAGGGGDTPCTTACTTLADCAATDDYCPGIDPGESRDALYEGCLETCAGMQALAAIVNSFGGDCAQVIPTVSNASADFATSCQGAPPADTLFERLGGTDGVTAAVNGLVGRILADASINQYFLNNTLNAGNLVSCLVLQLSAATGAPDTAYPGDSGCRDMRSSHAGLGISDADFNALVAHLVDELTALSVAQDDIATIGAALGTTYADIVEAPNGNETIYHRLGGYTGIDGAVGAFIGVVVEDARINGFFSGLDADGVARLRTCLDRQVCGATGGPCVYGGEVDGSGPGVGTANPCLSMAASHAGMMNDMGNPITIDDFNALVEDLVTVLTGAGVAEADIAAIGGALAPTCPDIVADPATCPQ